MQSTASIKKTSSNGLYSLPEGLPGTIFKSTVHERLEWSSWYLHAIVSITVPFLNLRIGILNMFNSSAVTGLREGKKTITIKSPWNRHDGHLFPGHSQKIMNLSRGKQTPKTDVHRETHVFLASICSYETFLLIQDKYTYSVSLYHHPVWSNEWSFIIVNIW